MTQRQSQVNLNLINIDTFATLCHTTPRALRFYQQKGVFKPAKVDAYTGYRFYNPRQVRDFMKIKFLQGFQMSLKNIAQSVKTKLPDAILAQKLDQIKEELDIKQKEYTFLQEMYNCLTKDDYLKNNLKEEYLGPYVLFCVEIKHGEYIKINQYIRELHAVANQLGIVTTDQEITFYIDYIFNPKDTNLEIALICRTDKTPKINNLPAGYYFRKYPKTKILAYNYVGPYEYMPVFYDKFYEIVEGIDSVDNNSVFEMYITGPLNTKAKLSQYEYFTKIGFPIS